MQTFEGYTLERLEAMFDAGDDYGKTIIARLTLLELAYYKAITKGLNSPEWRTFQFIEKGLAPAIRKAGATCDAVDRCDLIEAKSLCYYMAPGNPDDVFSNGNEEPFSLFVVFQDGHVSISTADYHTTATLARAGALIPARNFAMDGSTLT